MRRKYFGLAMAAIATLGPAQAFGGDREIAQEVMQRLKASRDAGQLKNFNLDMKVNDGVVLFRGTVDGTEQRDVVLSSLKDVDGVVNVVNELEVLEAKIYKPKAAAIAAVEPAETFDFKNALETEGQEVVPGTIAPVANEEAAESETRPVAAWETAGEGVHSDDTITRSVAAALGKAKSVGHLKDFGVDVNAYDGIVEITGEVASDSQRQLIAEIARHAPGARGVRDLMSVKAEAKSGLVATPASHRTGGLQPLPPANRPQVQAQPVSYGQAGGQMINGEMVVPGSMVTHGATAAPMASAPVMGQPVPMAPAAPVGAPRYDSPNLPNYAWPGYAAYPNYAALTYPQQYSPSAFPYIGPFYPYPQVPLGWRKVSLEWDDGWWFLDFTDK
ncbi:BON domain-containing protein [Rhodopirellula sp. JC740]|uniref:BON domain-containing protein n=1 Tax=Rhodopirellula halodulae TaxID=2894198 RepID=A0ABS8NKE2_9BACT|nr:BON domain-containing protein [Rhodopirellula sp. JC740]MCC9643997.1 BON domain-containing protein [Rhodopirellula sp. JC740]